MRKGSKRQKRSSTSIDVKVLDDSETKLNLMKQQPSLITSLPYDLILDILARVSRCDYPTLSLVCKHFHSFVVSPEINERRSLLGCTEVHVKLFNLDTKQYHLYILGPKGSSNRLALIHSLPPWSPNVRCVAVGSKIYAFWTKSIADEIKCIDCRSYTVQHISNNKPMGYNKVADVIDRKIYIIGDNKNSNIRFFPRVMVFDTETQMWESEMTYGDIELSRLCGCVAMADNIYIRDNKNSFVYMPKERKWVKDEMLNLKQWSHACVVDDLLYYYDFHGNKLRAYDPKKRRWGVVKGVEKLVPKDSIGWSYSVNYSGKVVVLLTLERKDKSYICKILHAEIAIKRSQCGEIWGKIERRDILIEGSYFLAEVLSVKV